MSPRILCQLNANDGQPYEKKLVDEGLYVCPVCLHAYIADHCPCGRGRPSEAEIKAQWSEPFYYGRG